MEIIQFRRERSFNEVINVTFTFLKNHIGLLLKANMTLALPFIALSAFSIVNFFENIGGMVEADPSSPDFMMGFGISYFVFLLSLMVSVLGVYSISYSVFLLKMEDQEADHTIGDVFKKSKIVIWKSIKIGFLISLIMLVFVMVVGLAASLMDMGDSTLTIIFMLLLYIGYFYIIIPLSMMSPSVILDGHGIFDSIERSFKLVKGHWWNTFGVMFVAGLIAYFFSSLTIMPTYIYMMTKMLTTIEGGGDMSFSASPIMIVFAVFSMIGYYLSFLIPLYAHNFQYLNLTEKKEGRSLLDEIEQIGVGKIDE